METIVQQDKKIVKIPIIKKVAQRAEGKITVSSEMIAQKAYELYEKRGLKPGFELQDWLEAKKILEAGA